MLLPPPVHLLDGVASGKPNMLSQTRIVEITINWRLKKCVFYRLQAFLVGGSVNKNFDRSLNGTMVRQILMIQPRA